MTQRGVAATCCSHKMMCCLHKESIFVYTQYDFIAAYCLIYASLRRVPFTRTTHDFVAVTCPCVVSDPLCAGRVMEFEWQNGFSMPIAQWATK